MASSYAFGDGGLSQNLPRAIKIWKDAARLGSITSHYQLAHAYHNGLGVKRKNSKLGAYYAKLAARGGHYLARDNLGSEEASKGNWEPSSEILEDLCKDGLPKILKLC